MDHNSAILLRCVNDIHACILHKCVPGLEKTALYCLTFCPIRSKALILRPNLHYWEEALSPCIAGHLSAGSNYEDGLW